MEIMKIFSDTEGSERLYSVLMTEDELALFSDMKEEEEKKKGMSKGAKVALGVGGATAATGAGIYGANKVGKVLVNKAGKIAKEDAIIIDLAKTGILGKKDQEAANKLVRAVGRNKRIGELLQKPAKAIAKRVAKK